MTTRFNHPLWTHLPAVAALAAFVGALAQALPLPSSAPIHFGINGQPDGFGSPWPGLLTLIGVSAFLIAVGLSGAEQWSRREKEKSFNYWSLFDDAFVGVLAGLGIAYLRYISAQGDSFGFPWATVALVAGSSTAAAAILEIARPYRASTGASYGGSPADASVISGQIRERIAAGSPIAYWEVQNPLWNRIVAIAVPLAIAGQFAVDYFQGGDLEPASLVAAALIIVLLLGGMRTAVDRNFVTVRFGTPGIRALKVAVDDVESVALRPFVPLGEFHGYGIRYNGYMKGVFLRGGVGVELTTRAGRHYLIGSDEPERLAAIIEAVASAAGGNAAIPDSVRITR